MGDSTGKSIAHTNLGIIYDLLKDLEGASGNHERALHHAIKAGDRHLQAIAVGHLGLAGCACKDYDTARACMEKYLELTSQLGEIEAREHALLHLGYIAKQQGDEKSAVTYYHAGLDSAKTSQNSSNIAKAKVQIGIIMGNTMLEDHMEKISAAFAT
uniref:Tetratricopeptide repeat protein 29 n=1 Tax=Lotharella oceanica TaxID=641309 RepID=A0A7S2TKA9_9EUKA